MRYKNGDIYEGDFKNDKMEGQGRFIFDNGNTFEGRFKNDKFEGDDNQILLKKCTKCKVNDSVDWVRCDCQNKVELYCIILIYICYVHLFIKLCKRCFFELVNDSTRERKAEVKCPKCNREFKHETIERFLEEEDKGELLNYFKSLWNRLPPSQERKFAIYCTYL
jgi:hypothetical protein